MWTSRTPWTAAATSTASSFCSSLRTNASTSASAVASASSSMSVSSATSLHGASPSFLRCKRCFHSVPSGCSSTSLCSNVGAVSLRSWSGCTLSSPLSVSVPVFSLLSGALFLQSIRPATKVEGAAGGVQKKDSAGKRLGWKIPAGRYAKPGAIIYRQRGNQYYAGWNVEQGRDHTLWSRIYGKVVVTQIHRPYRKRRATLRFINVLAHDSQREELLKDFHQRQVKLEMLYFLKKDKKRPLTIRKQMEVYVKVNQTRLQRKKDNDVVQSMLKEIQAFEQNATQSADTPTTTS